MVLQLVIKFYLAPWALTWGGINLIVMHCLYVALRIKSRHQETFITVKVVESLLASSKNNSNLFKSPVSTIGAGDFSQIFLQTNQYEAKILVGIIAVVFNDQ
jgi:hypothetical protein